MTTVLSLALRRHAAAFSSAAPRARKGADRAIHRTRVATRRLREVVPVVARAVDLDEDDLPRELRRVTKALGPVRELDVARGVLADFASREAWPAAVVARVDTYCEQLRDRAFKKALDQIDDLDVRALRTRLDDIADELDASGDASGGLGMLTARLRERGRALLTEMEAAGTVYSAVPLHRVRVAAKKLRYVLELGGGVAPDLTRKLKKLQSLLGRLHDAQILQHRIQELAASTRHRRTVAALSEMERSIEAQCREWHGQILKSFPKVAQLTRDAMKAVPAVIRPRQMGRPVRMGGADRAPRRARIA